MTPGSGNDRREKQKADAAGEAANRSSRAAARPGAALLALNMTQILRRE